MHDPELKTSRVLELHVSHEGQLLLPIYVRAGASVRWPVELYTGQHRKLREPPSGARRRLEVISGPGSQRRRNVLALLDRETTSEWEALECRLRIPGEEP